MSFSLSYKHNEKISTMMTTAITKLFHNISYKNNTNNKKWQHIAAFLLVYLLPLFQLLNWVEKTYSLSPLKSFKSTTTMITVATKFLLSLFCCSWSSPVSSSRAVHILIWVCLLLPSVGMRSKSMTSKNIYKFLNYITWESQIMNVI